MRRFAAAAAAGMPAAAAPVTVLRPLCGAEPLLEEALRSLFEQDYPQYQIVCGLQDPNDPALALLERVRQDYPGRDVSIVVDPTLYGRNRKISNLINMMRIARHEILVVSDSDLHLPANYLARLVAQLDQPGVGLVTCLYIGVPPQPDDWPSALGATQISHHFLPGVLVSRQLGRQDCLGSTMMLTRDVLERTGGFEPLGEVLAEDNVLGQRVRALGLSIALADVVPAATVPEPCLKSLWQHEIRWTRTIRELAPGSLLASVLQYPLFWSLLTLLLNAGGAWSLLLFLVSWVTRLLCAEAVDRALAPRVGRKADAVPLWLLPARDILSVVEILASFWVNEVTWRGHRMAADGTATAMIPEPRAGSRASGGGMKL